MCVKIFLTELVNIFLTELMNLGKSMTESMYNVIGGYLWVIQLLFNFIFCNITYLKKEKKKKAAAVFVSVKKIFCVCLCVQDLVPAYMI